MLSIAPQFAINNRSILATARFAALKKRQRLCARHCPGQQVAVRWNMVPLFRRVRGTEKGPAKGSMLTGIIVSDENLSIG